MTTTATSATPSGTPGADGVCGYQHGMAPCLPMANGRTCCSINGYCGSNETYCFRSNGCQYGCVDPASFYSTLTTVFTLSVNGTAQTTTKTSPTSSSSSNASSTANAGNNSGLSGKAKIGAIAGGAVGGVAVITFLAFLILCLRRRRRNTPAAVTTTQNETPDSTPPQMQEPANVYQGLISRSNHRNVENEK
ncbi:uncharacterized protein PAC_02691 [Phialocephala subalpina]|uniref:Chitin-binding type-1 domain-containing protein n=1 Tax=Phialocephala subalpina TaxID=576137 RepID=A0A1L7WJ71_9HELO|nr:uncharacterized protein PAC_02691 [Phialocephala subalpina]